MMEGLVAVGRIAGKDVDPINYLQSPSATYCEPQIGSVGLTEAKAVNWGTTSRPASSPLRATAKHPSSARTAAL